MTKDEAKAAVAAATATLNDVVAAVDADPKTEPHVRDQARRTVSALTALAELLER